MDTDSGVSLNYILASTKNRLRITDSADDEYMMQLILDCISETSVFHFSVTGVNVVTLDVNSARIAYLPQDYIDYVVIGVVYGNKIIPLFKNEKLALPITEDCGEDANEYPASSNISEVLSCHWSEKSFRIDKKNHRIILSNDIPANKLYMEYNSTGVNSMTIVPRYALPMIRQYVIWQIAENDPKIADNDKERKGWLYGQEMRRIKEFLGKDSIGELFNSLYYNFR